jgi:hypothetical protein
MAIGTPSAKCRDRKCRGEIDFGSERATVDDMRDPLRDLKRNKDSKLQD